MDSNASDLNTLLAEIAQSIIDLSNQNIDKIEQFHDKICHCSTPQGREVCRTTFVDECLKLLVDRSIVDLRM